MNLLNLSRKTYYIIGGILLALLILLALWTVPQWQSNAYREKFTPENIQALEQKDRIQLEKSASDVENNARVTLAQIIGGFALLLGLYFTYKNIRVTEEGKITDRFSKAVELLGSKDLELRLGGIYALERIARDSQKDHWTVMEVLTAFVREKSLNPNEDEPRPFSPSEDIQAIMSVIGRRKWQKTETQILNLRSVNLFGCNLEYANLSNANLSNANLNYANLRGADLRISNLSTAYLKEVNLHEAKMDFADLSEADLSEANLSGAELRFTNLYKTNLSATNLTRATIEYIYNTTLSQILSAKNFEKANSILPPELKKELEEWQAKQSKNTGAGVDSSENQAGE